MTDDIVTKLRGLADLTALSREGLRVLDPALFTDAADEIERLRAIERYAEHRDNCEQPYSASKRICNCGLSDLLEARRG